MINMNNGFNIFGKSPDFMSILDNFTQEDLLTKDKEVLKKLNEELEIQMYKNFLNCGASKRYCENVGFEKFVKLDKVSDDEKAAQNLLFGIGKLFLETISKGNYKNLILCGNPGIGKTFTSLCIMKEICKIKKETIHKECFEKMAVHFPTYTTECLCKGIYRTSDRLCEEMKQAQSFNAKVNKYQLIDSYSNTDLLIVDEIGRTAQKNEKDTLFAVLDARHQNLKPSILITNYSQEDLQKVLGEALSNRIFNSKLMLEKTYIDKLPNMREMKARGCY